MHKCTKSEPSFKQLMSGSSESVKNIVGKLREYSELVVFDNVGWEKIAESIQFGIVRVIFLSNKIRLLDLESY